MERKANMSTYLICKGRRLQLQSLFSVFCLCLLLCASPLWGQTDQGSISGVVQDPTGSAIPGARVILTATDTNFSLERSSNENGLFVFSPVKIGNYKITVRSPGFQTVVRENL